jgi:hypothetical protein
MADREKVEKGLRICTSKEPCNGCPYLNERNCSLSMVADTLALLDEQSSLIGTRVAADGITFISTGTAQDGEARGLLLGKMAMHEWLKKELFYRGLLTDEIRAVFDEAKRRET